MCVWTCSFFTHRVAGLERREPPGVEPPIDLLATTSRPLVWGLVLDPTCLPFDELPMRTSIRNEWRPLAAVALLALAVRGLLMLGRGDYIGFDEGWYLLLADSLANGDGYRLSGLQHTTFSPLFPALVASLHSLGMSLVAAGRWVSVLGSAVLVFPAWYLFREVADRATRLSAVTILALLPSLTAFVPFWSGRELFVGGSEPLFHLVLYSALALLVRPGGWRALGAGLLLGLGFLARPEAVVVAGLAGAVLSGFALRKRRPWHAPLVFALSFAVVIAPWLVHLKGVTGDWTLTGRTGTVQTMVADAAGGESVAGGDARGTVELLWGGNEMAHIRSLFSLDASATQLRNTYWGVPASRAAAIESWEPLPPPDQVDTTGPSEDLAEAGWVHLYARTLGIVFPLWMLPLAGLGLFTLPPRDRRRRDLPWAGALAGASLLVAALVHVDPRNHLFLAPLLTLYAAGGALWLVRGGSAWLERTGSDISPRFLRWAASALLLAALVAPTVRRANLGFTVASPQHLVATENRAAAGVLRSTMPEAEVVMSWHPALAIYSGLEWRVLPYEPLDQVLRYGAHNDVDVMVLSAFYPGPVSFGDLANYIVLETPEEVPLSADWGLRFSMDWDAEHSVATGEVYRKDIAVDGSGEGGATP